MVSVNRKIIIIVQEMGQEMAFFLHHRCRSHWQYIKLMGEERLWLKFGRLSSFQPFTNNFLLYSLIILPSQPLSLDEFSSSVYLLLCPHCQRWNLIQQCVSRAWNSDGIYQRLSSINERLISRLSPFSISLKLFKI